MIFSHDRMELRKLFFSAWQKHLNKSTITDLEQQIIRVIEYHPEYHHFLAHLDNLDKDFPVESCESNPFLHMSLHISLIEQVVTNRPYGINNIYQRLCQKHQDEHQVHHKMMDYLAESIWSAQKNNLPPDEKKYLLQLQSLL